MSLDGYLTKVALFLPTNQGNLKMPFGPDGPYALDDLCLRDRIMQIIIDEKIELLIETGLNQGRSTLDFCFMAPAVIGIDNNPDSVRRTEMRLSTAWEAHGIVGRGYTDVVGADLTLMNDSRINRMMGKYKIILGNSPDILADLIKTGIPDQTLFFLDAHWGPYWPLPDEVRALPRGKGVIVVHDIKVPGKPFGFDGVTCADGIVRDFEYSLIKDVLTEWSPTHRVEYNDELGHPGGRGTAFIYPR
jgi:hypothetical protein